MGAFRTTASQDLLTPVVSENSVGVTAASSNAEEKRPPWVAVICLAFVNSVEGFDMQMIPCCLFALQRDVGLTLGGVAALTSTQMILCNVSAVFWGIIADRGLLKRRTILTLGCVGEAAAVMGLAFVQSFWPMIFLRAMTGVFLACLRPVVGAMLADMTSDSNRGEVFGKVTSTYMIGMLITTMVAGNVSDLWIFGLPGWRLVMVFVSLVVCSIAGVVGKFMIEPPHEVDASKSIVSELWSVVRYLQVPTFSVMVANGVFSNMPWTVLANNLLFFQLCGLPDWQGTFLTSTFSVTCLFGGMLGGVVGDALNKRLGFQGRPLAAQISVAIGIPLMYVQFWGIPAGQGTFPVYLLIFGAFGLLATWPITSTNMPIISHIVPSSERTKVMAWEGALESSLANAIAPAAVAILADSIFGYKFGDAKATGKSIVAATALGKAMAVSICLPWMVSLLSYSVMHWSYPRDVQRLEKANQRSEHQTSAV